MPNYFDDPEMDVLGWETQRLANLKRNLPRPQIGFAPNPRGILVPEINYQNPETTGQLNVHPDFLSGMKKSKIYWNESGIANQDPMMYALHGNEDVRSVTRLTPFQDPDYLQTEAEHIAKRYSLMTPEQIKKLHYTDEASFPSTVERELAMAQRRVESAKGLLERQRAIQQFEESASPGIKDFLTRHKATAFFVNALNRDKHFDLVNKDLQESYQGMMEDPQFVQVQKLLAKMLGKQWNGFPENLPRAYDELYSPSHINEHEVTPELHQAMRRALVEKQGEWRDIAKKAGLDPVEWDTTPQAGKLAKWNTGGYLLGGVFNYPIIKDVVNLVRGGEMVVDPADNSVKVLTPQETEEWKYNKSLQEQGIYPGEPLWKLQ